ncbi:NSRP1 [Branchiostoma lanceolatum]|uniref:Nuclear speckle splicing regulatory protein 1 n=1 Tax=Branchiostoma lanceolatum TaxID=7740 RepID=A0A8J9ZSM2_BRALA|nr:NSRP1 [Branchiostoma lanceolatum]
MASNPTKSYGLTIPKKGLQKPTAMVARPSIFGDDSDEDTAHEAINRSLLNDAAKKKIRKQTQLQMAKALEEDASVYEYDSVYDDMKKQKEERAAATTGHRVEKKPKYIKALLSAAQRRKLEEDRRMERKVQKEREEEGQEFADKDAFVTSAYKKKLQELREEEERERREAEEEARNDVTKQKDMSGFYRHLLAQTMGRRRRVGHRSRSSRKRWTTKLQPHLRK